jgi:hypothetical protein
MNNIPQSFSNYFNKQYTKLGYLDKYGGSVIISIFTLLFFFLIISYYYIQTKIEPIKKNWVNERCKPSVMPFAGIINAPKGQSKVKYAADNFTQCTNIILTSIVGYFIKPLYFITDKLGNALKDIFKSLDFIRVLQAGLKDKLSNILSYIFSRIFNVLVPLQKILLKFKDLLHKISGAAITGLYTVYGSYLALKSFVGAFLEILIIALIVLLAVIVILWILPFTWFSASVLTAFFVAISIPIAITANWINHILQIQSSKAIPSKKRCFDKNTNIKTKNGNVQIKNLKTGTILENGDKVTAVFKLAIQDLDIYNLDDIIVTGNHKVFHNNLGWINVDKHPLSSKIDDYREDTIYCFNTDSKSIYIDDYQFLDWDELEPIDILKLKNLNYLAKNAPLSHIHKYLESGLDGNTLIELEDGRSIKLKNVSLNDQLKFNERVIGLVKIETQDLEHVKYYTFDSFNIIGSSNIHINDSELGCFNTLSINGKKIKKPSHLYHLITDTGEFTIHGITFKDYDSGIENILDIRDKLFALF